MEEATTSKDIMDWGDELNEDLGEQILDYDEFIIIQDSPNMSGVHCCRSPLKSLSELNSENADKVKETCVAIMDSLNMNMDLSCLINEISNSMILMSQAIKFNLGNDNLNIAFADSYLRQRHEIFHGLSMLSLSRNYTQSDVKFCDVLPIASSRTPDLIAVINNDVMIIETTATTDMGKSYQTKGKEDKGYKPKYQKEIEELQSLGFVCNYFVLIFNIKDPKDNDYKQEINKIAQQYSLELNLDVLRKIEFLRIFYCDLHETHIKIQNKYFSCLFLNEFSPNNYPTRWINKLLPYDEKERMHYVTVSTSNNIFAKIIRSWGNLARIFDKLPESNNNYVVILDLVTNKLSFKVDPEGIKQREWSHCLNSCDKVTFFANFKTYAGTVLADDYQKNMEFFLPSIKYSNSNDENLKELETHTSSYIGYISSEIEDYSDKSRFNEIRSKGALYEDSKYEELLESKINEFLCSYETEENLIEGLESWPNKKPFSSNTLNQKNILKAIKNYEDSYNKANSFDNNDRRLIHQKPSTIYPLINMMSSSYTSYKEKPVEFLELLCTVNLGPYTNLIVQKISKDDYVFGSSTNLPPPEIVKLEEDCANLQRKMHKYQMENKTLSKGLIKLSDDETGRLMLAELKEAGKKLKEKSKSLNYKKKNLSLIRLPTRSGKKEKALSNLGKGFQDELSHFKRKKEPSIYKGVGRYDYNILNSEFSLLKQTLLSPCDKLCPDKILDTYVADDVTLLKQLKEKTINDVLPIITYMMSTNLYHSSAMISRLCYTLSYFSQTSINSDYIFADNLGTDNCLLICKGGKKIFKTKRSKLFRLFFKTYETAIKCYSRIGYVSSFSIIEKDCQHFVVTPWISLEETYLNDGLTFLSRSMGYCLMDICNRGNIETILNESYFNIMLAIHGRRSTEEFMHNMRYITVNCMSEISQIDKMLPELANFNSDFFQCYLRESLLNNFYEYATTLKKFHDEYQGRNVEELFNDQKLLHLFDKSVLIDNLECLTMTIYCTFIMTKAPITQSLEQVKNLKKMLKTHEEHANVRSDNPFLQYEFSTISLNKDMDIKSYWGELFENDFIYDPKYVTLLGNFMSDYIMNRKSRGELESRWNNVLEESWDEFANTSGLRGDRGNDFFGKKGYYIVYKELLREAGCVENIMNVLHSEEDDFTKRKKLNKLNQTYRYKLNESPLEEAIFHVVEKRQRGGSREIYVMDMRTKLHQQPIEKYMGYLCGLVPNEIISIPSNHRLFHIHTNVFEKYQSVETNDYNIVLDCRRWAPHSVVNKFIDFIIGMRDCLPRGFVIQCLNFFDLMFSKKIYTRKYVYDILAKNRSTKEEHKDFFIFDETVDGYYFTMSYSWVMGIFNYFSSLLHVANQMHACQIIARCCLKSINEDFNMHMNAHSDDSGGKLICESKLTMLKSFTMYELLLKSSNHLLSDKKCNIGKVYFELLSILYIGNKLLSLLSKFTGAFDFHPSDSGYCMDITESYSKCIELIMNGSTFSQAYLAMKIMSYIVWRFYFGNEVAKTNYKLPVQLLGMPDAHPINIMTSGGDADLIRLYLTNDKESDLSLCDMIYFSKYFNDFDNFEDSFIVPFKATPRIIMSKGLKTLSELSKELTKEEKWVVNNLQLHNTGLNLISFLEKLKQRSFCASLQDETLTRRISRAFFYRNADCIETKYGLLNYKKLNELINIYCLKSETITGDWSEMINELKMESKLYNNTNHQIDDFFEILHSEIININKSLNNISYLEENIISSHKTCKPIHMNIQRVNSPLTQDFSPSELTAWLCLPKTRWLLPTKSYNNQQSMLEGFFGFKNKEIPLDKPNWIYRLLNKYKGKYVKEYYMHSNMPAGARDISSYKDLLYFLAHNSFKSKFIDGIVSPYSRTMTMPIEIMFEDFMDAKLNELLNLMDIISGSFKNRNLYESLMELNIKGRESINILQYLKEESFEVEKKYQIACILTPHIKSLLDSNANGDIYNAEHIQNSFFHCYVKRQHLVGNVWLGKGKLFVNMVNCQILIELENLSISRVICSNNSFTLDRYESTYIDYVLQSSGLNNIKNFMKQPEAKNYMKKCFGINYNGNYGCYDCRDLMYCIIDTRFTQNVHWVLSNLRLCDVQITSRLKYKVSRRTENGLVESFLVHTFDIPIQTLLEMAGKLFDTESNRLLIMNKARDIKDYLTDLIGESTLMERKIDCIEMLDNYHLSIIYTMIKKLNDEEKINMSRLMIREHYFPGQEGGFLDVLMKYKDLVNTFEFDYQKVLTPELMKLKSTQPDVFISNLISNVKEKYQSLYSDEDKRLIIESLTKVIKLIDSDESDNLLINMLTTWGYIGVMGSLSEYTRSKDKINFSYCRYDPGNLNMKELSLGLIKNFFKTLLKTFEVFDVESIIIDKKYKLPKNTKQLKMFIINYVHSHVLTSYCKRMRFNNYILSSVNIMLSDLLKCLFKSESYCSIFQEELEIHPILANCPVDEEQVSDWMQTINTIFNNVLFYYNQKELLINNRPLQRLSSSTIYPAIMTKEILSNVLNFSATKVYHSGTLSRDFYREREGEKTLKIDNTFYVMKLKTIDILNKKIVPLNSEYLLLRPIDEDFIDDEDNEDILMDLDVELKSREPDLDEIESFMGSIKLKEKEKRGTYISYLGRKVKAIYMNIKFVNLIGCYGSLEYLNRVTQLGEIIVIAADYLISEFIEFDCETIKVYQAKNSSWHNKSMIDPQTIYFYVKDYLPINDKLWETYFNCLLVNKIDLASLAANCNYGVYYNSNGIRLDQNLIAKDYKKAIEILTQTMDYTPPDEGTVNEETVVAEIKVKTLIDELIEKGFDKKVINKYERHLDDILATKYGEVDQRLLELAKQIMQDTEEKIKVNLKIDEILKSKKDKKFVEKVFEVAEIFAVGRPTMSDIKNRSLKNMKLRAELEAICPRITNLILSNTLNISSKKLMMLKGQLKMAKVFLKSKPEKLENKKFLLDVMTLILNDAHVIKDSTCDFIWERFLELTTIYITQDESDDEVNFENDQTYERRPEVGFLSYRAI